MNQLVQILVSGAILGAVYAMTALGFSIVFNATKVINFAHGDFVMMGGLITAAMSGLMFEPPAPGSRRTKGRIANV